jgi:regulator of sigma E protease
LYYVLGLLAIGVMIIVHEVGHYVMAKINGVKVLEFSIGFGPKIIKHQGKETLFSIALLPVGGYVNMLGSMDDNDDQGDDAQEIEQEPENRYFKNKSPLQRFSIIIAGPLMNIILAIALFSAFYTHFGFTETTLSQIQEQSAAEESGLTVGDKIVGINGGKVFTTDDINIEIGLSKDNTMDIEVERDGNIVEKSITPKYYKLEDVSADLGFLDTTLSKIEQSAAKASGLEAGDKILSINGEKVLTTEEIELAMQSEEAKIVKIEVERAGDTIEKSFSTKYYKLGDDETEDKEGQGKYMLGILFGYVENPTFIDGFKHSLNETATIVTNNYKVISNLVQGKGNLKTDVGGPVAIMQISSSAAKAGVWNLLYLIAAMSAGLGIINLLPLPVLDGGNCILILIELVTRRKVPDKIVNVLNTIGFVLLFGIMILVTVKDILFPMNF